LQAKANKYTAASQYAQRGAAATKRSRRNHCAGCSNTALPRRAEMGDFVA